MKLNLYIKCVYTIMSKRTYACGSRNILQCCSSNFRITMKHKKERDYICENYDYGNVVNDDCTLRGRHEPPPIKSKEGKSDEKYNNNYSRQRRKGRQYFSRKKPRVNGFLQAHTPSSPPQESILFRLLRANNIDNNDGDVNVLRVYEGAYNNIFDNENDGYDSGFDEILT